MNETVPVSPAKSAVMYGVLFGVIMILEFVISYVIDVDPVSNPSYGIILNVLNMLILPILLISLGLSNYKKINGGFLTLGESLKIGVTICIVAAILTGIFQSVFNLIFPDYVEDVIRKTRTVMLQNNPEMPAQGLEMGLSWTRKFMQPEIMIPFLAVMYSLIGLIYSLIIGAIVKKEKPQSF